MAEPVGSGFALGKLLSGVAGFFGGLSVSFFWQPKKLHSYGRLAAGAIIGGISVAASIALGGIASSKLGIDMNSPDNALGVGYMIGIVSVGIISFLANYFDKRDGQDILEVAQELKGKKKPAKKKIARKKNAR
jgi:hypothetical protein